MEFEYEAKEEDELSLKVGDILTHVVKQPGGWWEGVNNGKKGVFPDNFVKVIWNNLRNNDHMILM